MQISPVYRCISVCAYIYVYVYAYVNYEIVNMCRGVVNTCKGKAREEKNHIHICIRISICMCI